MAQQKWHDRRKRGERIPAVSLALDTPDYTPGENYYIDAPEAFRDQDVEHERADEMAASTQYWVTSAFYLHWISPDQVIHEDRKRTSAARPWGDWRT